MILVHGAAIALLHESAHAVMIARGCPHREAGFVVEDNAPSLRRNMIGPLHNSLLQFDPLSRVAGDFFFPNVITDDWFAQFVKGGISAPPEIVRVRNSDPKMIKFNNHLGSSIKLKYRVIR
jgi:hypothetical protein